MKTETTTLTEALIKYLPFWLLQILKTEFQHDFRHLGVDMKSLERIACGTHLDTEQLESLPQQQLMIISIFSNPSSVYHLMTIRMILFMTIPKIERRRIINEAIDSIIELPMERGHASEFLLT